MKYTSHVKSKIQMRFPVRPDLLTKWMFHVMMEWYNVIMVLLSVYLVVMGLDMSDMLRSGMALFQALK